MNGENKLMILGAIIIFGWAFIWFNIVDPYSNFVFRIVSFGLGFAFSSSLSCLPLVWFAQHYESQGLGRTKT